MSTLLGIQNAAAVKNKSIKVPLLHRPTSLSNTHDEMTKAVRFIEKNTDKLVR
jgi:hypothetical protein